MLDVGVLVETLETATFWSNVDRAVRRREGRARPRRSGEPSIVLCHISHVYETGCSLYFTVAAKEADDPLAQWHARQGRRQRRDDRRRRHDHPPPRGRHRPQAVAGRRRSAPLGVSVLRAVKADLDPTGILNPGVLIP